MPKPIIKDIARQAKQIAEETISEVAKQPGEMAGKVLEQMGITSTKNPAGQQKVTAQNEEQIKIDQMKAKDKAKTRQMESQLKKDLESEMARLRRLREEQLRQRREQKSPIEEERSAQDQEQPLSEIHSKPKRGLLGSWGKRIKSAQQQSQPEMAGKRVGG